MIDGSPTWVLWSTYRDQANAVFRRDHLAAKGHRTRAVNSDTGEIVGDTCPFCSGTHTTPSTGECLI